MQVLSMETKLNTMKKCFVAVSCFLTVSGYAQYKFGYDSNGVVRELKGTDYVMTSFITWEKAAGVTESYLMFINTRTGEMRRIDFPKDASIQGVEQVKLDSLGINRVVIVAKTINYNGNKSIDWRDPRQVIVLSADGKEKVQITENNFFAHGWIVNSQTGAIVVSGLIDSNANGKADNADKDAVLVYDLKSMKPIAQTR